MPHLIIIKGTEEIDKYPLVEEVTTIGRRGFDSDDRPDISLSDPTAKVSRCHAAIVQDQTGEYFIRDLGSLNATRVNGNLIYRKKLRDGDRIQIGDFTLIYKEIDAQDSCDAPIVIVEKNSFAVPDMRRQPTMNDLTPKRTKLSEAMLQDLNDIVKRAATLDESDVLFHQLIHLVGKELKAETGFIAAIEPNSIFRDIHCIGVRTRQGERISFRQGTITCSSEPGKPIRSSTPGETSILCCILAKQDDRGILVYLTRKPGNPFEESDEEFVAQLSRHIGRHLQRVYFAKDSTRKTESLDEPLKWKAKMVGKSQAMEDIRRKVESYAKSDINMLLLGETGSGKEVLARMIHEISPRKDKPFEVIELSKSGEELVESDLFGHVKGAFTGAIRERKGVFERAQGGTVLLDEIGDVSLKTQAKLRRALEKKEFSKVGSEHTLKLDVRVISATNVDLEKAVEEGAFREDLKHRLGEKITIPPLRARKQDIPLLAHYFIDEFGKQLKAITHGAMIFLLEYSWPGNVRKLKNLIEGLAAEGKEVVFSFDLPEEIKQSAAKGSVGGKKKREEIEKAEIIKALQDHGWNIRKTARYLEMSVQTLYNKMKKYGIKPPRKSKV